MEVRSGLVPDYTGIVVVVYSWTFSQSLDLTLQVYV